MLQLIQRTAEFAFEIPSLICVSADQQQVWIQVYRLRVIAPR